MRGFLNATLVATFLAPVTGCAVPVAAALDDREATEVAVALEHGGIVGQKEDDPAAEGKYRITVARDDSTVALGILREEEMPKPHPKGVLESMGQGALVPSQLSEHATHVVGLSGDLERTLLSLDGVLRARVHLNLPAPDPLKATPKTTASVLIEHRGATPPVTQENVQRLIAGGLPNLAPADVAVVFVARPARVIASGERLSYLGPFAVSHGSKRLLQGALFGLVLLILALASTCLALYARVIKAREKTD
jgi:type III secretion protein J